MPKVASVAALGLEQRTEQAKVLKKLRGDVAELDTIKRENSQLRQALASKDQELTKAKTLNVRLTKMLTDLASDLKPYREMFTAALRGKIEKLLTAKDRGLSR